MQRAGSVTAAFLVAFRLVGAPHSAGAVETTCSEVPSHVTFEGLNVVPEKPTVGSQVELRFDVSRAVYSVTEWRLEGASPLLEGAASLPGSATTTFRLTAVRAGRANVQLVVTYGTEEQCVDSSGYTYYRFGPDHSITSPSYVVDVAEALPACAGDCDGDGAVSIDELVRGVNVALGDESLASCAGLDRDGNGAVTIDELIIAINAALFSCAHGTQPTPTPTRTNPPGNCCCAAVSFEECQALAQQGTCFGWGDPCPTLTPTVRPETRRRPSRIRSTGGSIMEIPFAGGCACGAIRYECSAEPIMALNCHCRDCQRASGTAYASGIFVPASAVRVTKGDPKYYVSTADSGSIASRGFCAECGSPVMAKQSAYPVCIIYAASLDDPSCHRPTMEIFTSSAQPWDYMDPALPKYSKGIG